MRACPLVGLGLIGMTEQIASLDDAPVSVRAALLGKMGGETELCFSGLEVDDDVAESGGEVLVCSSSGDDADLLSARDAPGILTGGVLGQDMRKSGKKRKILGKKGFTEDTSALKIAAVCEVQAAYSLDTRDDGAFILNQENRHLHVSISCIGKTKRLDKVSDWACKVKAWQTMAKDHRIIEKYGGNALSVLTRAPQW